jgi:hypothetical protein
MKKYLKLSLILSGALFLSACGVKNNDSTSKPTTEPQQPKPILPILSLQDLIVQNIPQKCTWTSKTNDTETFGTILISGNRFNQQIFAEQTDNTSTIHNLSDGIWIYSWQESSSTATSATAFKMKFDAVQTNNSITPGATKSPRQKITMGNIDLEQKVNYNCSPTIVSDADFQPPKDIKFNDYSQFLDQIKSSLPSINPSDLE